MTAEKWLEACKKSLSEAIEEPTDELVDQIRTELLGTKVSEWKEWRRTNERFVLMFAEATHEGRSFSRQFDTAPWQTDPQERLRFLLARTQLLVETHVVLAALSEIEDFRLLDAAHLGSVVSEVGGIYQRIVDTKIPLWPFDGENPFVED